MTDQTETEAAPAAESAAPGKVRTLDDLVEWLEGDVFTEAAKAEAPTFAADLKAAIEGMREDFRDGCCFCDPHGFEDDPLGAALALSDFLRMEPADTTRRVCDALISGHTSDFKLIF